MNAVPMKQPQQLPPVPVTMSSVEIQPSTSSKTVQKADPFELNESNHKPPPLPPRPGNAPPLPPRPSAAPNIPPRADTIEKPEENSVETAAQKPPPAPQTNSVSNGSVKTGNPPEKPKTLQMTPKISPPSTSSSSTLEPAKHFLYQELISKFDFKKKIYKNLIFRHFESFMAKRDILGNCIF